MCHARSQIVTVSGSVGKCEAKKTYIRNRINVKVNEMNEMERERETEKEKFDCEQ
jgi:hypothetical protein